MTAKNPPTSPPVEVKPTPILIDDNVKCPEYWINYRGSGNDDYFIQGEQKEHSGQMLVVVRYRNLCLSLAAETPVSTNWSYHRHASLSRGHKVWLLRLCKRAVCAVGRVVDIVYLNGRRPTDDPPPLPDYVMVRFTSYTGPAFIADDPQVVPIVPVSRSIECACRCTRVQVPLRLAWGMTIHKCQGMTVGEGEPLRYVVIHPGKYAFEAKNQGALFVALSRAKTAGGGNADPDFALHEKVLVNEDSVQWIPVQLGHVHLRWSDFAGFLSSASNAVSLHLHTTGTPSWSSCSGQMNTTTMTPYMDLSERSLPCHLSFACLGELPAKAYIN
ncbi:predicted protein [Nematostella vectensis]|uniref:ATP-dependent DNA helicase n=1 Tax=Nematostella vectensis TaxID=45351 RepID=A7SKZ2_NEMVE|nr:predicted protein [Nematostella vectensis]|eukprot:XP_001627701.1 predicted protein [Nematostella vectensis]